MFQQRMFITQAGEMFLGRICVLVKSTYDLHHASLSVCLSLVCISSASTGWIYVQFFIPYFYYNLLRKSKFGYHRTRISGVVCEDIGTVYCCLKHKIIIRALS
jgi:hypothetical protein